MSELSEIILTPEIELNNRFIKYQIDKMAELEKLFYIPSQDQLEKIVPKQISMTELQNKINQQSIEIDNLNKEISRLRNEMMNLIQAAK